MVPHETAPRYIDEDSDVDIESESQHSSPTNLLRTARPIITKPDEFGLFRVYADRPSWIPTNNDTVHSVADDPNFSVPASHLKDPTSVFGPRIQDDSSSSHPAYHPFPNASTHRAMDVFYKHTTLSGTAMDEIVAITQTPDFKPSDWSDFDTSREMKRLDRHIESGEATGPGLEEEFGWKRGSVTLKLPAKGKKQKEKNAKEFVVEGVLYRDLLDVLKSSYESPSFVELNLKGFTQMWKSDADAEPERLHGEAFTSNCYLRMEEELRRIPTNPNDSLEHVIAPYIYQSDSTHLANFGTASLWPFYGYSASQSKYARGKPTNHSARHFCYAPTVSKSYCIIFTLSNADL